MICREIAKTPRRQDHGLMPQSLGVLAPWRSSRFFLFFVPLLVLASPRAWAQGAPQVQAQLDEDTVGVGDVVHLEMSATSADEMPSDPRLGASPGLVVRGQSASPAQTHININGNQMDRYTLTVDWALQAQRVGTFRIGPPSVLVGGARVASSPLMVHVVPAGRAPHQHSTPPAPPMPFGFSPFDPWKGLIQGLGGNDRGPTPPAQLATDPKLSLDAARGNFYFLHATVDKVAAVVGEQVTFSVYEYRDVEAPGEVDEQDFHDAQAADFVKHPLLREDQEAPLVGYASVGGRTWVVKLVRRWALFPLRAGDLALGSMSVTLARPRAAAGGKRSSETLHVRVSEPPLAGRPPGYAPGDVGHFVLAAQVQPRDIEQGGAVGVHVELSGTGNVPSTIAPPARAGVEWLAPEVHEQLGPAGHDAYGGSRSFDYVVRPKGAGDVDLGELALPFWDPEQKRYDVARAALGGVHIKASATAAANAQPGGAREESLPGLPAPRDALEGAPAARRHADDSPVFWVVGVGAWPLAFGVAVAGRAAGRRAHVTWRTRRASPAADLRERVAVARAACRGNDARTADAAIARALEAATLAHVGVSVRDAVGREVLERLEKAGVTPDAASRVAELLRECDTARFAPEAADVVAARDRWLRAQGAIRSLERRG
jgi:hypothetical protein